MPQINTRCPVLPGGGWSLIRRDDVIEVDVRLTLETDEIDARRIRGMRRAFYVPWRAFKPAGGMFMFSIVEDTTNGRQNPHRTGSSGLPPPRRTSSFAH